MKPVTQIAGIDFEHLYLLVNEKSGSASQIIERIIEIPLPKTVVFLYAQNFSVNIYSKIAQHNRSNSTHFALAVLENESEINMQEIVRFFFLSSYKFYNKKPILFFSGACSNTLPLIRKWCSNQYISTPQFYNINISTGVENKNSIYHLAETFLPKALAEIIAHSVLTDGTTPAMINVTDASFDTLKKNLLQVEEEILCRADYAAIKKISTQQTVLTKVQQQTEYLKNEINILKDFNALLKNQSETEKILNFYHQQYEVLPLWYKQVGHIIKIITGHRKISFKKNKGR